MDAVELRRSIFVSRQHMIEKAVGDGRVWGTLADGWC
jgi:hypothetical protein